MPVDVFNHTTQFSYYLEASKEGLVHFAHKYDHVDTQKYNCHVYGATLRVVPAANLTHHTALLHPLQLWQVTKPSATSGRYTYILQP